MNCFYIIKLPGGGEVKFSANLTRAAQTPLLDRLLRDYVALKNEALSADDLSEEAVTTAEESRDKELKAIKDQISEHINSGLSGPKVSAAISAINPELETSITEQFINRINSKIDEELTITNINDALFKILRSDATIIKRNTRGTESKISISDLLFELNKTLSQKYFQKVEVDSLIGVKSVNEQITSFNSEISKLQGANQSSDALTALKDLIGYAFPNKNGVRSTKSFYNATFNKGSLNTTIVVEDEATKTPIFFYNNSNELSLFLGIFTYLSSKLNASDVSSIVKEYNEGYTNKINLTNFDVKKFFLGYINEEGEYMDPEFFKMLSHKTGTKSAIDKIINLVADDLLVNYEPEETDEETFVTKLQKRKNQHIKVLQTLFKHISPDKYGSGTKSRMAQVLEEFNKEDQENREFLKKQRKESIQNFIHKNVINYHFDKAEEITKDDINSLQDWALSNVKLYQDIISIPLNDGRPVKKGKRSDSNWTMNLIPTSIVREKGGIRIDSGFWSANGIITELAKDQSIILTPDSLFYFKKLNNLNPIEDIDSHQDALTLEQQFPGEFIVTVKDQEKLPEDIVKTLVKRGSTVSYDYYDKKKNKTIENSWGVVRDIFPGEIRLNSKTEKRRSFPVDFRNIKSFTILNSELSDSFTDKEWSKKRDLLETLDRVQKVGKNYLPIKPKDFVKIVTRVKGHPDSVFYNQVAAVSDDKVYIIVKTRDADKTRTLKKIIAQPRESIVEMFTPKLPELTIKELQDVAKEYDNIYLKEQSVRDANFSYFLTAEAAQDGDYFVIPGEEENSGTLYKIISKKDNYAVRLQIKNGVDVGHSYEFADFSKANLFITKRDIAPEDGRTMADFNNFTLVSANSADEIDTNRFMLDKANGFKLVPARYVIPKLVNDNISPTLLKSGNYDVGSVRWGPRMDAIADQFSDVTEELIKDLNKLQNVRGKQLFLLQKDNGYIKRYNKSLKEYILQDKGGILRPNYNKFRDYIKTNTYFCFAKSFAGSANIDFSNKMFKVVNTDNGIMTLEYNGINNDGKIITIRRSLNIDKAFNDKVFKAMYLPFTSENQKDLDANLDIKPSRKTLTDRDELAAYVGYKFANLFDIEVSRVNWDTTNDEQYRKYKNKKAWIEPDVDGKPTIVINMYNSKANEDDVVHEFLHLFLTSLRYTKPTLYDKIIEGHRVGKLKEKALDAFTIEEDLVTYLSQKLLDNGLADIEDDFKNQLFDGIVAGLAEVSEDLSAESFNDLNIEDLEGLLSASVKDITGFNKRDISKDVKNANLIFFDANFRDWLQKSIKEKKIKINCK